MPSSSYSPLTPFVLAVVLLWQAGAESGAANESAQNEKVSFNQDIRPILSDKCFHCHGPDEKDRKAGLRLDQREAALKGGDSGPVIVPGKPEESEVLVRMLSRDKDEMMPPPKLHKPVSAEEAGLIRRWIAQGAEYQGHWAFLKPERPTPPGTTANPIDAFILKKLAEQGLAPSPEASKETLIRRVTLDLTGLPPTPQEVADFEKDADSGAYERCVDRLLASPRYGEQMAVRWLDLARYADSNGFQTDSSRTMWPWRDWVINAFNKNQPFDQFTIEQLAGDLLPNPTREQLVATGFNRNHRLNGEGGRIVEEWFAETVIDRVETSSLTWMALTYNCCRCHDHKYDPISQKNFYEMFSYFNSNDESGVLDNKGQSMENAAPTLPLPSPEQVKRQDELKALLATEGVRLEEENKRLPALQVPWEKSFRTQIGTTIEAWRPLREANVKSTGGAVFTRQPDESWLTSGVNPPNDTYEIEAKLEPGLFTGLLLEILPDPSLPGSGGGRGNNGALALTGLEAEITVSDEGPPTVLTFRRVEANVSQPGWDIGLLANAAGQSRKKGRKKQPGWAMEETPESPAVRKALFVCDPVTVQPGATLSVRLIHASSSADQNIGRFRLNVTGLPPDTLQFDGAKVPETVSAALLAEPESRTQQQRDTLAKFFRANGDHPVRKAEAAIAATRKGLEDLNRNLLTAMIFRELPKPRPAFVFKRGEYDKPGEPVTRGLPAFLPPLPAGAPNNRLGIAQWLVSGEHPLTARVWVNREWERFFGVGIVKSTENFGSQADWPSHPQLLDWLATEFVRLRWDMKAMQRLIVTSATYKQSPRVVPEALEKDPDNRLLSHAPRLRLPAEAIRDQALAVSGLLVEKVGGPSVKPYMPVGVWDETSVYGDMRHYQADIGAGLYRRTLYTIWKRTAAPPSMLLFDSPNREICTVKRSRSNTPLQALALLNETTYVEAARRLAERMLTEGGATPEARIAWAFQRATDRQPDSFELQKLTANLRARLALYAQNVEDAEKLIAQGASKPDSRLNPAELAAYTVTANVLLNLDEIVTRN